MARQLVLLEAGPHDWKLDDATRALGKQGVAAARTALAGVRCPHREEAHHLPAA